MSDDAEWGPWIEHDGKVCPCVGMVVDVRYGDGLPWHEGPVVAAGNPGVWIWAMPHRDAIIRYRIRKPRAPRDLIKLVENLPAPERERSDA